MFCLGLHQEKDKLSSPTDGAEIDEGAEKSDEDTNVTMRHERTVVSEEEFEHAIGPHAPFKLLCLHVSHMVCYFYVAELLKKFTD